MKPPFSGTERRVIPRWRSLDESVVLSELMPDNAHVDEQPSGLLEKLRREWQQEPGIGTAGDLLSVAVTTGAAEEVRDVAKWLVEDEPDLPEPLRQVAMSVLGSRDAKAILSNNAQGLDGGAVDAGPRGQKIKSARASLNRYSRNPYLWLEIARQHTILGFLDKARRELQVARHLAPEDRLVLRSAARFFLHEHDAEQAAWILGGAQRLRSDPWLLAAEIASRQVAGKTSRNIPAARDLLQRRPVALATAELSAALATVELHDGKAKRAKELFDRTLAAPTENSFSQAVWAFHEGGLRSLDIDAVSPLEQNFEGPATDAFYEQNWGRSLRFAQLWLEQEPFSGRPVALGSFICSVIEKDWACAEEMLRIGLKATPDDSLLLNNLAFVLASRNELLLAAKALSKADVGDDPEKTKVARLATRGLIEMRSKNLETGTQLYLAAIEEANRRKDVLAGAMAAAMLLRELEASGGVDVSIQREAFLQLLEKLKPNDRALMEAISRANHQNPLVP